MKKFLISFLIVTVLVVGGLLFLKWQKYSSLTIWSFVPSDATFVFESNNVIAQWKSNKDKKIWNAFQPLPFFQEVDSNINTLDSLFGEEGALENFFDQNRFLLSTHITSKNTTGSLYLFELKQTDRASFLDSTLNHYISSQNLKQSSRQYLGYDIQELSHEEIQFSYMFYKNFFIGSFTTYLIEDAIRVLEDSDYFSFAEQNNALFGLSKIENDQGNFYVNSRKLADLLEVFTDPIKADISSLGLLTDLSFLDIAINDESIVCNGFSLNSAAKGNYLDSFEGVESSEFLMVDLIPASTASLFHFSFDDGEKWHKNLKNFWRKNNPNLLTNLGELENKYDFPVKDLYTIIGNELAIATMEAGQGKKSDLLAYMHISDAEAGIDFFNNLSDATNTESNVYKESYKSYDIRQIAVDEVPMRFFGPLFSGFATTYYTLVNDYVLLANSKKAIKNAIDDVRSENTWGKSLSLNNFLEIANREANLSLYLKTRSAFSHVKNKLNEKWLPAIKTHSNVLNQLGYCAVQFSNVDGKYYTNIAIQHSGKIKENITTSNAAFLTRTDFPFATSTKPYGVRNHNDRSLEFVLQDEINNFYLLSSKYDTIWSKPLEGKLISDVYQIDYYKNRKLQYLFATENEIQIIDRTGTDVPGYPIALPGKEKISFLSLVDYDDSKNYRILATTEEGKYYMFDKSGRNLKGWNPKKLDNEPATKPFHLRVRNSDVLVFTHKNGTIEVLNRRGESKKGFPLNLEKNVNEDLFIEQGANLNTTYLTAQSQDGELIKFNLAGKIVERKQLFRNKVDDKFRLLISSDKRSYVILRTDERQTTVLDMDGEEKFSHEYPMTQFSAQYYDFNTDNEIYVLTDSEQEFTYVYDQAGTLLSGAPINTGNQIAMLYQSSKDSYKIFLTFANQFSVLKLNR